MAVEEDPLSIGIDLGTTYASVGYYDIARKGPVLIQDERDKEQVASWISLSQLGDNGNMIIGNSAKDDIHNECIIYDSKRIIGRGLGDINDKDLANWPFKVKDRENGSVYIESYNPLTQDNEEFEPEEISGMILKYLYEIAQKKLGNRPISNVVVTVPVDFNDKQRDATLTACELAGIKNVSIENEPTAAITEYKREYSNSLKNGNKVVVIDFGGGTLDVCCCKISNDSVIVESSGGDPNLGGNDFDNVMIDIIKERVEEWIPGYYRNKRGMTQKEKTVFRKKLIKLKKEAERIKIGLSDKANKLAQQNNGTSKPVNVDMDLELENLLDMDEEDDFSCAPISSSEFDKRCENSGIYKRFVNKITEVTQRKGYKSGGVQLVLLIGGTSKIPKIREKVSEVIGGAVFANNNFNPLTAVVKGATYSAYKKGENAIGKEVIYDIVPTPIGIEVEGGKFDMLIEDGKTLPTLGTTRRYCTTRDNQTSADFIIYRGFGRYVTSIGMETITKLSINGIPTAKRGEQKFEFTIQINQNGMMEISASLIGGDIKKDLSVTLDLSKKREEIEKLKEHFSKFY
ncbi:heat shock protein 70kD, putative [Entamoeba dispar SAW760]|uniref:Heat shock protein 70kD, putative n=1 Tax=Entamoeba dispar (strain ATCC PRA-260 / SAW760) TaxID=370354 RepID=B0EJM6_ENTDS|nr:heat shock protein 70kD, putative [Entamoeba dispar SAW760]EDR25271.1 heat shock protein 70kD, putative [Entamoeba dispar SAW760]|eukprot:EDR25271.1 heat shock protein 70kD, putative [Entamoeba dispar SAW760]